jgi:hypothetical protein
MTSNKPTYTRTQAMSALGIKSASTFHHLRNKYPRAFIVIHKGMGRNNPTLYDKTTLDQFVQWRNQYRSMK